MPDHKAYLATGRMHETKVSNTKNTLIVQNLETLMPPGTSFTPKKWYQRLENYYRQLRYQSTNLVDHSCRHRVHK